jgi:hypothetical protein
MRLFPRGPELPGWVRSAVPGRPLAAAPARDGTWLVGTRDELHAVSEDRGTLVAVPWERVQRADWDAEAATLRVEEVQPYGRPLSAMTFGLDEPVQLLELVRERVTASVVVQRRVPTLGRRGFSVIGRRAPAGTGEVIWAYEFDAGVDPDDPLVTAAAEIALHEARESLGL